ncbi:50S ribosomal protein L21 [Cohaesibacter haloalkalitolerans]|uniref:50S ribosomal protein L21 n=1 Tax=Cohaesibacter haloalkalitolerans TaxID=1162980 RepID=UPI000E6465E1|nr:50S ribosomal protein L21 [Cohaesibacter haloalkalitolerans]
MFAVIKTGGKQYTVSPEDVIKVEKLEGEAGETVVFDSVLLVGGEGDAQVGAPLVDGASVAAEIVDQGRGRKIIIFKKRRRQNSRRRNGHRQYFTTVKISEILTGGKAPAKAAKKATPAKAEAAVAAPAAAEGDKDDLKKLKGLGKVMEGKLNEMGITTYAQIAAFTAEDIEKVEEALAAKGRFERDNWIEQAATLAAEK